MLVRMFIINNDELISGCRVVKLMGDAVWKNPFEFIDEFAHYPVKGSGGFYLFNLHDRLLSAPPAPS